MQVFGGGGIRFGDGIRFARRLARRNLFRGRREYVPVGCGKNVPVFHAPGKGFRERSVAGLAAGMFAVLPGTSGGCFAAQQVARQAGQPVAHQEGQQAAPRAGQQIGQQGPPGSTLDRLMKLLAQRKHGTVTYVEEDYLAILDRPVKSSGVLVYDAPDRLEKRTLKPKRESLVLQGDDLTVERRQRTYRMQLSAYPQVAPLIAAVRDTLAGNEEALEKVFEVDLSGALEDWKLQLVPLDPSVAHKVKSVAIAGARDAIRSVEILQVDGDRSVMILGAPADRSGLTGSNASGAHR